MQESIISWTEVTWNPIFGCHKVSEGCRNCYAETIALKFGLSSKPWTAPNASENVVIKPHKLKEPYSLKEPSRVFVNSMSDMFHENIPNWYRALCFAVMIDNPQHTFQVLTKRPERATDWLYAWQSAKRDQRFYDGAQRLGISPLFLPASPWNENIWIGTSVENAKSCARLDALRSCPAHTRFVSFEPLIGEIPATVNLVGFQWAIVGGESGSNFRPMPHAWARNIRDACQRDGVAFFFKQSAAYRTELGTSLQHEDGRFFEWQQFPDNMRKPEEAKPHCYVS
jgi:protein gp37